jgi:uncharacterized cupin superfamily protein
MTAFLASRSDVLPDEARLEETESGLAPTTDGWFIVNVRDARWGRHEVFGAGCRFEGSGAEFSEYGINIRVIQPGEPACLYHRENAQEDFLVLAGDCLLLVEGEERRLKAWDFVHCPPETEHVFVGAGDEPCAILMVGTRVADEKLFYPVSELAQAHGASVDEETTSGDEAYAKFPRPVPARPDGWEKLPWA